MSSYGLHRICALLDEQYLLLILGHLLNGMEDEHASTNHPLVAARPCSEIGHNLIGSPIASDIGQDSSRLLLQSGLFEPPSNEPKHLELSEFWLHSWDGKRTLPGSYLDRCKLE